MNRLKEELEKILCDAISHQMDWESYYEPAFEEPLEQIMEFINQNYISREEVEGLKMEEEIGGTYVRDGWNFAVRHINKKINDLIKK